MTEIIDRALDISSLSADEKRALLSRLLRERADGPWMLFGAVITENAVIWEGSVAGVRYGTDSPIGDVDDTPNAMLQRDGRLALG